MEATSYKEKLSDIERGMLLKIMMDISLKDETGISVKKQCLANIGDVLLGNYVEPTSDFIIGYNMRNEVICKEIKSWDDYKKSLVSQLVFSLVFYEGKMFIEELNEAKFFYEKTRIKDSKFETMIGMMFTK